MQPVLCAVYDGVGVLGSNNNGIACFSGILLQNWEILSAKEMSITFLEKMLGEVNS